MGIMNTPFENFTQEVCSQIKCTEVHDEIKEELNIHLEEIKEEYLSQGATEEEATRQALAHIGNGEQIGYDLNKVYEKKPPYATIILTLIIAAIGLFVQFEIGTFSSSVNVFSNSIFLVSGILTAAAIYFFDYRKLEKYSVHLFIAANLLILLIMLNGVQFNGYLTLYIMNHTLDISIFIILLYIISINGILVGLLSSSHKFIKIVILYLFCIFMLSRTLQIAYNIAFSITYLITLINLGFPKKYSVIIFSVTSCVFAYQISFTGRLRRFASFLFFNSDKNGSGFINYRIHQLLSGSKLFGTGTTAEILNKLPAFNNDFIFCYIVYTFGWLFAAAISALIILLLINLFKISKVIKNIYGRSVFISISIIFTLQFLLSISANLNLAPAFSVSMPFFSTGGSNLIFNLALIGFICSIYSRKNLKKSLVAKV